MAKKYVVLEDQNGGEVLLLAITAGTNESDFRDQVEEKLGGDFTHGIARVVTMTELRKLAKDGDLY